MEKKSNEWKRDTTFQSLELCLAKFIQSTLEWLFPPADAPAEVMIAAQEWRESRIPRVTALLTEGRQILKEIGRRYRWLSGQSTAIFARAETPDVYIPEDIEEARELELRSRRAQSALQAQAKELPHPERERDTAFQLLELRLAKFIQITLELLFPPADAPVEVMMAAQERRESMMPKVIALLTEERRILTEIGRHRRWLSGQSTPSSDRAIPHDMDVYIEE